VIPDRPSAAELQAALTVTASFGRMTAGRLAWSLLPESALTAQLRKDANLVFVGKAASFGAGPTLRAVELPARISGDAFSGSGLQAGDGVVQMALSPWDPSKVLLVVGGNSDAGVVKAAQAFSYGQLITSERTDLAVIVEVRPETLAHLPESIPVDRTFTDLGYAAQVITGRSRSDIYIDFTLPRGQAPGQEAALELAYNHSELIDYGRSGVEIYVNGQPVGSVRMDEGTSQGNRKSYPINPSFLNAGENQIVIQAELQPRDECSAFNGENLWFTVYPESVLHVPLSETASGGALVQDLSLYPFPFLRSSSLANLAFILPQEDLLAWQAGARLAFHLGDQAEGVLYELAAAYANQVPQEILESRDLILVGAPTSLPILAEINADLPGPFEEGSRLAKEPNSRVVYRLPEGTALAYLKLLPSRWNPDNTILAVLGVASEDLAWAVDALTVPALRGQLFGDFAVIQGERVLSSNTRLAARTSSLAATLVPGAQAAAAPKETPIAGLTSTEPESPAPAYNAGWILPAVGVLAALMLLVLGIAFLSGRRAGRVQAGEAHPKL
jgi:hypothetical protein